MNINIFNQSYPRHQFLSYGYTSSDFGEVVGPTTGRWPPYGGSEPSWGKPGWEKPERPWPCYHGGGWGGITNPTYFGRDCGPAIVAWRYSLRQQKRLASVERELRWLKKRAIVSVELGDCEGS